MQACRSLLELTKCQYKARNSGGFTTAASQVKGIDAECSKTKTTFFDFKLSSMAKSFKVMALPPAACMVSAFMLFIAFVVPCCGSGRPIQMNRLPLGIWLKATAWANPSARCNVTMGHFRCEHEVCEVQKDC